MRKVKRKVKKKIIISLVVVLIILGIGSFLTYYFYNQEQLRIEAEKALIKKIKSHYSEIVKIKKETPLYEEKNGKYTDVGTIGEGEVVSLDKVDIDINTKYFKVKELGYYVKYQDVEEAKELVKKSDRYKKYLLFNENVVLKENSKLLRDGKLAYSVKKSIDTPIILKDDNGYYIEYFNEMLFVSKDDVLKTYEVQNTDEVEASSIPVTVYHFIYLDGDTSCNEAICHSEHQIREHFNYLKTNNFFTMNTTELRLYLEGKLRAPKKSILVTIDDGARAWNFIPIMEEYQVNATLFLISGWYYTDQFPSDLLEIASHTHNLHTPGKCPGGQGSPLKCMDKTKLLEDLAQSRYVLFGTEAFCYPFYEYNDYAVSVLKEAGFKIAFIGGNREAKRGDNLLKVPRIPLNRYTTLNQYINIAN